MQQDIFSRGQTELHDCEITLADSTGRSDALTIFCLEFVESGRWDSFVIDAGSVSRFKVNYEGPNRASLKGTAIIRANALYGAFR